MTKGFAAVGSGLRAVLIGGVVLAALAACGGGGKSSSDPSVRAPNAAQLAEARRLIDPDNEPHTPTPQEVACVAQVVVQNPDVDQIANDMAQVQNKDLRQLVMTDYLTCAYNYVLDLYMRFAPPDLAPAQLACIRSKFTQLSISRLSEVIVDDPDAGYTGPLVIASCKSGSTANPLAHGTIPSMGGS